MLFRSRSGTGGRATALIAEEPRHGYEIIKLVEEKTSDWYSPSPGIVYPTLTYLEEAGYVTASTEGAKKLYAITAEGRVYLEANRDVVDAVLDRLSALGVKFVQQPANMGPVTTAVFDDTCGNLIQIEIGRAHV